MVGNYLNLWFELSERGPLNLIGDLWIKFHGVGQGLFSSIDACFHMCYSRAFPEGFAMVFDCGSKQRKNVARKVRRYIQRRNSSHLDVLVISHLHEDHVNGLPELLSYLDVDTVILPYLTPLERLLIAGIHPRRPAWYYGFLADPPSFFLSMGARRVLMLKEGERPPHDILRPPERGPPKEPIYGPYSLDIGRLPEVNENVLDEFIRANPNARSYLDKLVFLRRAEGPITVLCKHFPLIVLIPFVKEVEKRFLEEFKDCLKEKLRISDPPNTIEISRILRDRDERRKLKECYHKISRPSQFNLTSLAMYLMLVYYRDIWAKCLYTGSLRYVPLMTLPPELIFEKIILKETSKYLGVMFTGDLPLRLPTVWKKFYNHYSILSSPGGVLQIPHHGSDSGCNIDFFNSFKNSYGVISCGVGNKYGHPHPSTVQEAFRILKGLFIADQKSSVEFLIRYLYR